MRYKPYNEQLAAVARAKPKTAPALPPDDSGLPAGVTIATPTAVFAPENLAADQAMRERTWFRNILYHLGEQWIRWYQSRGTFGPMYPLNPMAPTPVSNIIRDHIRTMRALVLNKQYVPRVWPNSQEQQDKDAAEIGQALLESIHSDRRYGVSAVRELVLLWELLTGNGFAMVRPDNTRGKLLSSGSETDPFRALLRTGDISIRALGPFQIRVPSVGETLREKRWVGVQTLEDKEWVEDTYHVKLAPSDYDRHVLDNYITMLTVLVASVSPWKGAGLEEIVSEINSSIGESVLVQQVEYRPSAAYPNGIYRVDSCGQMLVRQDEMPIPVSNGEWQYSVVHFPYNITPGSFWACSSVDDLISPQNTINRVDQALETNRDSLGRPWVLTPAGLKLKRRSTIGSKLLEIVWDPRTSMGAKPQVQPGVPYPAQVLEERNIHRQVAQEASGDPKNILRGQSPHSGASGIMVDILRESAEMSHAPDIKRFYECWADVCSLVLVLAQKIYTEDRILKTKGSGSDVQVRAFRGADLRGNNDVRMELVSGASATQAGRTNVLMQLISNGFFGDVGSDEAMQNRILSRMGLGEFRDRRNPHIQRAERENSIFAEGGDIREVQINPVPIVNPATGEPLGDNGEPVLMFQDCLDPVFEIDDDEVHLEVHDALILGRQFKELDEEHQLAALAHRATHMDRIREKARQQAEAQAAMEAQAKGGQQQEQDAFDLGEASEPGVFGVPGEPASTGIGPAPGASSGASTNLPEQPGIAEPPTIGG